MFQNNVYTPQDKPSGLCIPQFNPNTGGTDYIPIQNSVQPTNPVQQPQFQPPQLASLEAEAQERMRIAMTPKHYVINNPRVQLQEPVLEYDYGDGRDFVSAVPDITNPAFNQEIANSGGLENVIKKYPYEQLKIDDNGKLAPVKENLSYDPTITNAYHVMYHSNLNKQKKAEEQKKKDTMESIAPGSTTPNIFVPHYNRPGAIAEKLVDINDIVKDKNDDMYTPNFMSLVDMGDDSQTLYGYEKIEEAYHMEPEEVVADYRVFREANMVIDPQRDEMHYIDNNRLPEFIDTSIPDNMVFKHPNPEYNKQQNQQIQMQQNPNYNYYSQSTIANPQMVQQANPTGGYTYDSGMNPNIFGWKTNNQNTNPSTSKIKLPVFNPTTGGTDYVDSGSSVSQPPPANIVDFSNMNAAQNQISNNVASNNMRNPNIQYGANSYNPYQARNNTMWFNRQNTYSPITYGGFSQFYGSSSATPGNSPIQQVFAHMTDFDYKNGLGIRVHVRKNGEPTKREKDLKKFGHVPEPKRKLTYLEKLTQVPKVRVYTYKSEEVDDKEEIVWDKKYMTDQAEAMKKVAQLVPTDEEVKMMEDRPLNLSEEDKKMAHQIADHMEEWDECYAEIIRMFVDDFDPTHPMMNWMTQDHFYVFMRLTKGKIKWLQRMDIEDKTRNYHKDYRYLRIPLEEVNPNNPDERKFLYRPDDYYELREVDANGNVYHEVDHGEVLPDNVRKAFVNDTVAQIKFRVEAVRQYEKCMMIVNLREEKKLNESDSKLDSKQDNSVCGYEIDGSNYGKDKKDESSVNDYWSNNYNFMSYGARLYHERQEQQRREYQKMVDNQKMVYRKAFGNSMTEKEFNLFWYGPQNNPDNQLDPVWKRQQELAAVTRANIEQLYKARPYPENTNEILNKYELKKIREMDKGCMEGTQTLKDYFDNFAYLGSLVQMDENRTEEKSKGNILFRLNQKMKANLGFVNENMEKTADLLKDALGIDKDILNKVTQDCFDCLSQDEEGNSYIDLTKNETWNKNRLEFIRKCQNGDQDKILPRYTPLPF